MKHINLKDICIKLDFDYISEQVITNYKIEDLCISSRSNGSISIDNIDVKPILSNETITCDLNTALDVEMSNLDIDKEYLVVEKDYLLSLEQNFLLYKTQTENLRLTNNELTIENKLLAKECCNSFWSKIKWPF